MTDIELVIAELRDRGEPKLARLIVAEGKAGKLRELSEKIGEMISKVLTPLKSIHNKYKKAKAAAIAAEGAEKQGLWKKAKAIYAEFKKRSAKAKELVAKRKKINEKIADLRGAEKTIVRSQQKALLRSKGKPAAEGWRKLVREKTEVTRDVIKNTKDEFKKERQKARS